MVLHLLHPPPRENGHATPLLTDLRSSFCELVEDSAHCIASDSVPCSKGNVVQCGIFFGEGGGHNYEKPSCLENDLTTIPT